MRPPVIYPRLAEHLPAEALFVLFAAVGPAVFRKLAVLWNAEGVRRGPQADDRLARFDVIDEVLHLLIRQIAEPQAEHREISRLQRLDPRRVIGQLVVVVRLDKPGLRINRKQHGAFEAMMLRENLRQLRQRLFRAVLVIPADEHDVLSLAGTVASLKDQPRISGLRSRGHQTEPETNGHQAQSQSNLHGQTFRVVNRASHLAGHRFRWR